MKTYRWVLTYLIPYWKKVSLFILCGLLITGVEISITKFVQHFVDVLIPNGRSTDFLWLLGFVCVLIIMMLGAMAWRNMLQREFQELAIRDLIQDMFKHLRKLGYAYYERNSVGETTGLFHTEAVAAQRLYRQYTPGLIQLSIEFIVLLFFLLHLSWQLSLWIIPFFFSYYLIGPYFEKRAAMWAKEANKERQVANKQVYDGVSSIHEVRAYGVQRWSIERVIQQYRRLHSTYLKQAFHAYARGTVRRVTTGLGAVAIFGSGIWLIRNGSLSVGEFVAYSIVYFQMMNTLTYGVTMATEQRILLHQLEVLHQFIKKTPLVSEVKDPYVSKKLKGEINFQDVSFKYEAGDRVLHNVSFHAKPGQKIAFVGSSGSGKTTLLKLLARFYDPDEGTILLDGVPLKNYSFEQLRSSIGFVFQETYLFGGSVRENILFGRPDASQAEVEAAAKAAYAHDFIQDLPDGYDTIVGERGIMLSGGQKQRIAIARMLLKQPEIVLLDEATSALDNVSEENVQKAFDVLLQGRTTIAVAHRLSTVQHFDQMIVMDQGRNVEEGTYNELLIKDGFLRNLVHGSRGGGIPNE